MRFVTLRANAKINLAIEVLGKRDDGYHDLRMIMQTLKLHDDLFIKKTEQNTIRMRSNVVWLPTDDRNLVYRATKLIIDNYNITNGVQIDLTKNIPVSAGLGGGSADCAATLIGMRKLFNLRISNRQLMELGATLGADVPFCVLQGTALVEGIGDRVKKIAPHPFVYVLLAKPNISVSTATIFGDFDISRVERKNDIYKIVKSIERKNIHAICRDFFNDLETVTTVKYPIINNIKNIMLENGASGAMMSGSGPTVFGYYRNRLDAYKAMKAIRMADRSVKEIYLTSTFNRFK